MKYGIYIVLLFCFATACNTQSSNTIDDLVAKKLSELSLKEKVGQMTQLNIDVISVGEIYQLEEPHKLDSLKLRKAIVEYGVGSILNAGSHAYSQSHWNEIVRNIQDLAMNETKAKIPVLYGIDAIHGANYLLEGTLFPQPLAQAATFNPELVKRGAEITAIETRSSGIPWNFSPVLDVARQPLWSRVFETYGEDVHLCTQMGLAAVKGYQGDSLSNPNSVAACLKHFLGYSMPFTGKDRTAVYVHERQLREYFLPSFEAAIKAGAASIMVNSGEINGIPVHADKSILIDLLRNELGFEGVVVTDWEDIMKLEHPHRVAKDLKEAVMIAVNAGIDMSMVPNDYRFSDLLLELVKEGKVPMSRIDESVSRILKMKYKLNLFESPLGNAQKDQINWNKKQHVEASYETACEAITLLKNLDSTLPISADHKLAVFGPAANSITMLNGAWSRTWQGTDSKWDDTTKHTLWEAVKINNTKSVLVSDPTNIPADCDFILACMGEQPSTEKPGDINSLLLEQKQLNDVKQLAQSGKKIILVLVENRPRIVRQIEPLCAAIIHAYQPSENGSKALADILTGAVNPSGRLPITYPKYTNTLIPYDHKYTDKLDVNFGEEDFDPQWEFGHGLSYSHFLYSNLVIKPLKRENHFSISVDVSNNSKRDGKETVLLFVSDQVASITPPVKRLRGFEKLQIKAGETKNVSFLIDKDDLAVVGKDLKWITEPGEFQVSIGTLKDTLIMK